jgi:hypothetical protein
MIGVITDKIPEPTAAQIVLPYDPNAVKSSLSDADKQTFYPIIAAVFIIILLLLLAVRIRHRKHAKSIYRNR